jgi:hypothetical protein
LQFIEYRPNVVMVMENGDVELIREREDLSDIERREVLPPRLSEGLPFRQRCEPWEVSRGACPALAAPKRVASDAANARSIT